VSNPDDIKCKIKSNETGICWNYYFNEYEHEIVYGS
jgi:Protein of unknown function (DUF229)